MSSSDHDEVAWGVVVPVKRLHVAKSRLAVLGEDARRRLALAFAEDVVRAAVSCAAVAEVLVVTDDETAAAALRALGARVVADLPGAGLNEAITHGAEQLPPRLGAAALSGDLPALRPEHLADALAGSLAAAGGRAVVADAAGSGTTLLTAAPGQALQPSFGPRSHARHRLTGAVPLAAAPGLRADVDTPEDLRIALRLGVGPSTAAATDALRSPGRGTMLP